MAFYLVTLGLVIVIALAGLVSYTIVFPRQPHVGPLPELTGEEREMSRRLRTHLNAIASKPHNLRHYANLQAAAAYIEATLRSFGLSPRSQVFDVGGREVRNIEVVLEPSAQKAGGGFVIGAHYDSPDDSPGANDNGTGTAALLELARLFADRRPATRPLRLVFFVNEEAPYFRTEAMGSWRYARSLAEAGEKIEGMIALETIGYFSDKPGSQAFPSPFDHVYSDTGNFIAFVGLPGARSFLGRALGEFRRTTAFPSIGGVAPNFIAGVGLSDHWAFYETGVPAFMVTDTAPFRNPFYHRLNDLPQNVDCDGLARVTMGMARVAEELAFR